jgi:predicted RNase H-like HicB family nuclease
MNIDPSQYSIQIRQIEVDGEMVFEARIKELPDVVDYGESVQEAYDLATDTIIGRGVFEVGQRIPLASKGRQ